MRAEKKILFDKFSEIESWAYRGKALIENGSKEKAKAVLPKIHQFLREVDRLIGYDDDLNL